MADGAASGALGGAASGASTGAEFGPWGAAIGGAIGLVGGAFSGSKADKEKKRQQAEAQKMAREDLNLRKEMYGYEREMTEPLRRKLTGEALSDQPLDYGMMSSRIRQNYANAIRDLSGDTSSGLSAARAQQARLAQATELAGAYQQGLANQRNLGMTLLSRDQSLQAGMNVSGGYENLQRMAETRAAEEGARADAAWGSAASGLGQLIQGGMGIYGQYNQPAPTATAGATYQTQTLGNLPTGTPTFNTVTGPSPGVTLTWGGR